jgi:hypothetical protein
VIDEMLDRQKLLQFINEWRAAYPLDVFPPSDIRAVLEGPEQTFTKREAVSLAERNAADMARHVLQVLRRKLEEGEWA